MTQQKKHPWQLTKAEFVRYLNNGFIPGEGGCLDHKTEQVAPDSLWPVPLDTRWAQDRPEGLFFFCRLHNRAGAYGPLIDNGIGLVRRRDPGRSGKPYELVGEYLPGHLFIVPDVRGMNLGAELLLASAEESVCGRPPTTTTYTRGGCRALENAHCLAVMRAIAAGEQVPEEVLRDYPDLCPLPDTDGVLGLS